MGLYKEVKEGEKANPFSVHKWAIKTRLKKKLGKNKLSYRNQEVKEGEQAGNEKTQATGISQAVKFYSAQISHSAKFNSRCCNTCKTENQEL